MEATVDKDGCISCGQCVNICPEVFFMADDGVADSYGEVEKKDEDSAIEARDACPVSVITVE